MKAGAIEFLIKPVSQNALITAIDAALREDLSRRHKNSELAKLRSCFALLTPREREVFHLVANGLLNKQAAAKTGYPCSYFASPSGPGDEKDGSAFFRGLVRKAAELGIPNSTGGLSSTLAG
jgi:YesN/AraC family two-component response regulator